MRGQYGGIAQLVEYPVHTRLVTGSNPVAATISGPLVKWLRHRPFTAVTWVRVPYGSPQKPPESFWDSGGFFQFPGRLRPPSAAAPGRDTRRHGILPPASSCSRTLCPARFAGQAGSGFPHRPAPGQPRPAPRQKNVRFPPSPAPVERCRRAASSFPFKRSRPLPAAEGAGRRARSLRRDRTGEGGPRFGPGPFRLPSCAALRPIPPHRFSRLPDAPSGRADAFRVSAARRLRPLPLPGYFSAAHGSSNLPPIFL